MENMHGHNELQALGLVVNQRVDQADASVNAPTNQVCWHVHGPKNQATDDNTHQRVFFKEIADNSSPKGPFFQNWTTNGNDDKEEGEAEVGEHFCQCCIIGGAVNAQILEQKDSCVGQKASQDGHPNDKGKIFCCPTLELGQGNLSRFCNEPSQVNRGDSTSGNDEFHQQIGVIGRVR